MNMFSAKAIAKTNKPMPESHIEALAALAMLPAPMARERRVPERQPSPVPKVVKAHGVGAVVSNAPMISAPQADATAIFDAVAEIFAMASNACLSRPRGHVRALIFPHVANVPLYCLQQGTAAMAQERRSDSPAINSTRETSALRFTVRGRPVIGKILFMTVLGCNISQGVQFIRQRPAVK